MEKVNKYLHILLFKVNLKMITKNMVNFILNNLNIKALLNNRPIYLVVMVTLVLKMDKSILEILVMDNLRDRECIMIAIIT
jgi:hypothetical protein